LRRITVISLIMVAALLNSCVAAWAGDIVYYTVKPGDTLYGIGSSYGINYRSVMSSNGLASTTIIPGMKLKIPSGGLTVHTVKSGETLYGISRKYGIRLTEVKASSGLSGDLIVPGMKLIIPESIPCAGGDNKVKPVFSGRFSFNRDDIRLLAKLIHAEARGEPLQGQVAVGAVIMNRLVHEGFPGTISDVVFQKTKGVYQFTPVRDGQINLEPGQAAYYAAECAIKGEDPTGGALFFYNPETSSDRWIKTLPVTKVIGNHVFAK